MLTEGVVQRGRDPGIRVSLGRLSSGSWCFLIETVSSVQGRGSEGAGRPVAAVAAVTAALQAGPGTGPGAHSSEASGSRLVPQTCRPRCCASPSGEPCSFSPESMPLGSSGPWRLPCRMGFGRQFSEHTIMRDVTVSHAVKVESHT